VKQSKFKQQLQSSNNEELKAMLEAERKNLYGLRQQVAMNQLSNKLAIRESRKKIARILTAMRERELVEAGKQAKA